MSKSLTKLPTVLKDIDLVIEARDARLPLTSINPAFEEVLEESWGRMGMAGPSGWKGKGKEKVVVYTKRDQAEEVFEEVGRRSSISVVPNRKSELICTRRRVASYVLVAFETGVQEARQPERPLCRYT
jgi:hypothetical protein